MICKQVDGAWHCQSESRLHVLLKEFDIGHRYHFPLVLAKSLVVLSCLFLSTHLHNDVSKQFLLTACAPVAAEIALNVVVLVLFLVDYFPNLDTVTTFLKLQKTFEVVVGDVYILASCVYLILNCVQMKTGRSLKKTTHILIFQALFLISSIFGVLTLIDHKLHDFSTLFWVYHCSLTVLCGVVFVTSGFYLLTITAQSDGRTRLREGLIIFPFLSIALSIFLAISPYFEDLCRLILKLSPIAILPVTVLFLPSFRRLFYCWERVPPIQDKKNTSLVRPVTPGWTNNQYRIEKMANGVYRVDVSR